jgi:hypothetical protein
MSDAVLKLAIACREREAVSDREFRISGIVRGQAMHAGERMDYNANRDHPPSTARFLAS